MTQPLRIIVVSNRGPIHFSQTAQGALRSSRSAGGLATALLSATAQTDITWIAVAGNAADRAAFASQTHRIIHIGDHRLRIRYVPIASRPYDRFYNQVSNNMLWFLQHYMLHVDTLPSYNESDYRAWDEGYVPVNQAVADAVCDEWERGDAATRDQTVVLLQDYQLYLTPGMIRRRIPAVRMGHFVHIPWAAPRYWQFLPKPFLNAILESLTQNSILGFQTEDDVTNFLECLRLFMPRAWIDQRDHGAGVTIDQHHMVARDYPIGIDPATIVASAQSRAAARGFASLATHFQRRTIVRVDRLDPTKNIVRGIQAYGQMLDAHPELVGDVTFVLMLIPSRETLERYRHYAQQVLQATKRVADRFDQPGRPAIQVVLGNDQARALAVMQQADVFLVNSILDGMHLGAKEFALLTQVDGVLVVSRNAGVYAELGDDACLPITPTDIYETANALYTALTLTASQRRLLSHRARRRLGRHTVTSWLQAQLHDILSEEYIDKPMLPTPLAELPLALTAPGWIPDDRNPGDSWA